MHVGFIEFVHALMDWLGSIQLNYDYLSLFYSSILRNYFIALCFRSGISGISIGDLPELSRTEEKEAMKTNNNKLANYIDNVRRLQNENSKMIKQIEVIESSQTKEISDLREIYDREIGDLKTAIRRMQDNYKDLQANSERVLTENMDLKKMQEKKIQVLHDDRFGDYFQSRKQL